MSTRRCLIDSRTRRARRKPCHHSSEKSLVIHGTLLMMVIFLFGARRGYGFSLSLLSVGKFLPDHFFGGGPELIGQRWIDRVGQHFVRVKGVGSEAMVNVIVHVLQFEIFVLTFSFCLPIEYVGSGNDAIKVSRMNGREKNFSDAARHRFARDAHQPA